MKSLRLGIDLDGVVYDFVESFITFLCDRKGFVREQLPRSTSWDFYRVNWGMSEREFQGYFAEGVDDGVIFLHGNPIINAKETLDKLSERHSLHIVTHRTVGQRSVDNTMDWLRREDIPYDTITFAKDKTLLKTDIFIEDNIDNFLALEAAGIRSVIMDRPWNKSLDTEHRVHCWCDFYEYVENFI